MVDVGEKAITRREAVASGRITMSPKAFGLLRDAPKGDVLATARIAAIAAAKRTSEWIPLCHALPLDRVSVEFEPDEKSCSVVCTAAATATAKTGVEMEALLAVQAGLLTIYDMLKAADKGMRMTDIRLLKKTGGRSGEFSAA